MRDKIITLRLQRGDSTGLKSPGVQDHDSGEFNLVSIEFCGQSFIPWASS